MPTCSIPEQLPPWACGFAQSYLDIGAILPTRDGRAIGNATILAVEPHDEFGFVVKLVTDAGNDVRMTEREVHTAFHRPKWIRRIDTPAERMRRADAVLAEVRAEVERAITKHRAWSSAHEGYAVLQEGADELWDEVKADRGYTADAMKEAIQVAAMGVRYVVDLRRE